MTGVLGSHQAMPRILGRSWGPFNSSHPVATAASYASLHTAKDCTFCCDQVPLTSLINWQGLAMRLAVGWKQAAEQSSQIMGMNVPLVAMPTVPGRGQGA